MSTLNWKWIPIFAFVLCSACGKQTKRSEVSVNASATAIEEPAFKIAEEQRKALDQAKQVEQNLQKAADQQRRAIEAATSEK
jgi:hypothetical protein